MKGSRALTLCVLSLAGGALPGWAEDGDRVRDLWSGLAPGETSAAIGVPLPPRAGEVPPATRIGGITRPQLVRYDPPDRRRNGAGVLIFPGGGYNYVVVDKEGSEAAEWLNQFGFTAWVVRYRTRPTERGDQPEWLRPLQDGQRALRIVRHHAPEWGLRRDRIGVLGFSAGGLTAAVVAARADHPAYEPRDDVDRQPCRPDFAMLVYPWQLLDSGTGKLAGFLTVGPTHPPTLLIHAHDDRVTPLNSVLLYAALKEHEVPAELHVYGSGGHGFGMRGAAESHVSTWPQRAVDWLRQRKLMAENP